MINLSKHISSLTKHLGNKNNGAPKKIIIKLEGLEKVNEKDVQDLYSIMLPKLREINMSLDP